MGKTVLEESGAVVSVASFNTRWGLTADGGDLDLRSAVAALDADIVVMQEVWSQGSGDDTLSRLAAALGYEHVELPQTERGVRETGGFADSPGNGAGRWGIAVLSRIGLGSAVQLPLGRAAQDPVSRTALRVDIPVAGGGLVLVTAHLTHHVRAAPAQLMRLRRSLGGSYEGLVLAGDFNCVGLLSRALLLPLRSAVRGRTWPARRPLVQLDHVFVGRGIHIRNGVVLGDLGSDHLPVRVELTLACRNRDSTLGSASMSQADRRHDRSRGRRRER